jgi:hypothetical protein
MENASTWAPRPAKTLRSFYKHTLQAQYGGLGEAFVVAAVELALLLSDIPPWAIQAWMKAGLEHQSLEVNRFLEQEVLATVTDAERVATLTAHYESSYVAMIISLNAMHPAYKHRQGHSGMRPIRPELLCTELLLKQRRWDCQSLCDRADVQQVLQNERDGLSDEVDWEAHAGKLLGLNQP